MSEWQPIETAPMDGTEILGWREDCGIILMRWTSCDAFLAESELEEMEESGIFQEDWFCADFVCGERMEDDQVPTHWMPLPSEPNGAAIVVAPQPEAWLFQHSETGETCCIDNKQVEWGFVKNNPRWQKICPLYRHLPVLEARHE